MQHSLKYDVNLGFYKKLVSVRLYVIVGLPFMERETRFELATLTLAT